MQNGSGKTARGYQCAFDIEELLWFKNTTAFRQFELFADITRASNGDIAVNTQKMPGLGGELKPVAGRFNIIKWRIRFRASSAEKLNAAYPARISRIL